jgi:hypothetical protein
MKNENRLVCDWSQDTCEEDDVEEESILVEETEE